MSTISGALRIETGLRFGGWLPNYHDMGLIGQLLSPLVLDGCSVTMNPMTFLRRPYLWLRMIDELDLSTSAAPNFAYELCTRRVTDSQLAELDLSRWSYALNASETVSPSVIEKFAERFATAGFRPEAMTPCYGLAESTLLVTGSGQRLPVVKTNRFTTSRAEDAGRLLVSCGVPLDTDLRIVDPETLAVLPPGMVGEVWVRGENVTQGYWKAPELTEATFDCVTAGGDAGFLRTGDLGLLEDGELYVVGRIKELIILRGRNLLPQDVEEEIRLHHQELRSGVGATFGLQSTDGGDLVVIAHEVATKIPADQLADLASSIKATVSREFGIEVDGIVLLRPGGVARTSSGKIQRAEMRRRFLDNELDPAYVERSRRLEAEHGEPALR
jgi:acyl-CoA synthetase (AMP-forming)/AMP-acid ligase II